MKQTIEIDVPDGHEIESRCSSYDNETDKRWLTIRFKKKEPEFIEVRSYLAKCGNDLTVGCTVIGCPKHNQPEAIEKNGNFIRWIDKEPRKVEI